MRFSRFPMLALAVLFGGNIHLPELSRLDIPLLPQAPAIAKRRRRAAGRRGLLSFWHTHSRGRYIPGGPNRNCGWQGINPKSFRRALGMKLREKIDAQIMQTMRYGSMDYDDATRRLASGGAVTYQLADWP